MQCYSEYIEQLLHFTNNKSVYIVGDTNIDILKYASHVPTKDFLDMLYSYGVFPQINKPTRVTSFSSTIIDNIFTNVLSLNAKSGILCNDISDHLPIFYLAEYQGITNQNKNLYKLVRRCSQQSLNNFRRRLEKHGWENVFNEKNVHKAYANFIATIKAIYNEECPMSKIK